MTDTWAAKVLEGVPRFDFDPMPPIGTMDQEVCGEWVRFDDALAAIARMGAGDDIDVMTTEQLFAHIAALTARVAEMRASISWVDEVYPERIEAGGAGLQITWEEFNAMQAALGVTVDKRIGGAEGKAVHNHRLRAKLKAAEAERDALRERVARLEGDAEFQEQQRRDAFARRHLHAPEDPHVYVLCERYGYGAVMDAASRLWARKDSMGAFYIGGCIGIKPTAALTDGGKDG